MISVEGTCLTALVQHWRNPMQSSVLNAPMNPGSPLFPATARHLQEALLILGNIDACAVAAAVAGLGVLAACHRLGLR